MGKSHVIDPYDLNHVVEVISESLPTSFDILGWSLGGLITLKMSLMYPEKIHRMVLVGGTPCFINQIDWSHGVDIRDFNDFDNGFIEVAKIFQNQGMTWLSKFDPMHVSIYE